MRRALVLSLFVGSVAGVQADAATINGFHPFGTLQISGQTLLLDNNGNYRSCFADTLFSSASTTGDGGTTLLISFPQIVTRQQTSGPQSTDQASFGGIATLTLTGEVGTGSAPNAGTLAFPVRGQGLQNNQSRTYGASFPVTNYTFKQVDSKTSAFSFVLNLNTFGSCKLTVTGTIPN